MARLAQHVIPATLPNDPTGFLAAIQSKARLLREGHQAGRSRAEPGIRPKGLLFSGMGFSGFGADLVRDAATRGLEIPFTVVKHYQFPHHVTSDWHLIAVSYSGETEETLAVTRAANARGVPTTAFTVGGTLQGMVANSVPQPAGFQPRAAFGYSWFSLLGWMEGSGLVSQPVPVDEAIAAVKEVDDSCGPQVPEEQNEARQLARYLHRKIPQIYATPAFYGVAQHFKGMLNENAKKIAHVEQVPECNHNDLTGWSGDVENRGKFTVLSLSHAEQNPQMRKRLSFMEQEYKAWGIEWHSLVSAPIHSFRQHVIEQARYIQFLDYTSLYVAALRGQDPADIRSIVGLKKYLKQ